MSRSTCSPSRRCGSNAAASRRAVSVWRRSPAEPERDRGGARERGRSRSGDERRRGAAADRALLRRTDRAGTRRRCSPGCRKACTRCGSACADCAPSCRPSRRCCRKTNTAGFRTNCAGSALFSASRAISMSLPTVLSRRQSSRSATCPVLAALERRRCRAARRFLRRRGRGDRLRALHRSRVAPDALVGAARRRGSVIGPALAAHRRGRSPHCEAPPETGAAARRRVREAVAGKAAPAADRAEKTALYGGNACSAIRSRQNRPAAAGGQGAAGETRRRERCAHVARSRGRTGAQRGRCGGGRQRPGEQCSTGTGGV